LVQPPVRPRQFADIDDFTVNVSDIWGEPDSYVPWEFSGENMWEDSIRLTREYIGFQVRDLWFEDAILYVDLMPITGRLNVGLGSIISGMAIRDTFEQFPADEVRFLVGGQRPIRGSGYNGFDLNCLRSCPAWGTWGADSPYDCICDW